MNKFSDEWHLRIVSTVSIILIDTDIGENNDIGCPDSPCETGGGS
mgnify:CR=1 FL=1